MSAPLAQDSRFARIAVIDMVLLGVLTVLIRLPAYFSSRHLTFDDGVFASSVLAMREGGVPFGTVFSSQGPLFLPMAYLGDLLSIQTLNGPRVLGVLSGVAVVLAVYWTAAYFTDRLGALVAGGLALTSGALMWVTGPLAADGPALAFATLGFGIALRHRDRPRISTAISLGLVMGATLSTKAMEAPILLPVALVLIAPLIAAIRSNKRSGTAEATGLTATTALLHGILAAISAAVVFLSLAFAFGLSNVWDQSFTYRADAAFERDPLANAGKLFSTLWDRDLVLIFFALVALTVGLVELTKSGRAITTAPDGSATEGAISASWSPSSRLLVWVWVSFTFLWLILIVSPLWRPHVSAVIPPLVLLVALYRPPLRTVAISAVLAIPLLWVQLDGLRNPEPYSGDEAEIAAILEALPEGSWGLSDEPGLLWRSGIRTTDDMVDPSMLRVQQGRYDEDTLITAATDNNICVVVVRSELRFGSFDGLGARLSELGFEPAFDPDGPTAVYVKTDCSPDSP